jgi:hypothetical protein
MSISNSNNVSLRIGEFSDVRLLLTMLKATGCHVTMVANEMMHSRFAPISLRNKEIHLSIVSIESLGFPRGATKQQTYGKLFGSTLSLCPWLVGPVFRLLYENQPQGETLHIGMVGIKIPSGDECIFTVNHGKRGFILDGEDIHPDDFYEPSSKFILMRGWN